MPRLGPEIFRDGVESYLREIANFPPLSEEEEQPLFQRAAGGDASARERIVEAHLPYVVKIAFQYVGYGLPAPDLISEGNLGLLRAVELFQPDFGLNFRTYAGFWIKQRIHRAITNQAKVIRIPVWRSQRLRKLDRLHEQLNQELGRDAQLEDLAERVGLPEESLKKISGDKVQVDSMDAVDALGRSNIFLLEDGGLLPGEQLSREELLEEIMASLHGLDDTELRILSFKFGLLDREPESYRAMAHRFGKSREWIRKVGEGAIAKLQDSVKQISTLPRHLVQRRRLQAQKRVEKLAAREKSSSRPAKALSLFPFMLNHYPETLILLSL